MKILFLCHRLPYPPRFGGQIRPLRLVTHLQRNHEVTVASLIRASDGAGAEAGLRKHCARTVLEPVTEAASRWRAAARLATREPSSMGYFHSPSLQAALTRELEGERYDAIVVHCSSVAPYVAAVEGVPKLLDFGDMDSQKWLAYARERRFPLSLGYALEARKLKRAEIALAGHFDSCTCTTRDERDTLRGFSVASPVDWFPNGVDAEFFRPSADPYDANTICFVGRMDYYPNVEAVVRFCAEVLPRLRRHRRRLEFHIVGALPTRAVRRLARQPGVVVTGTVADVRPFVRRAALSVAPLRIARGTQNKILQSLALGVPVVCSPLAARGVDAIAGEHLLAAADPEEWADAILRVLDDEGERRRLGEAGRARMKSHHDWEHSLRRFDRILEECCAAYGGRAAARRAAG